MRLWLICFCCVFSSLAQAQLAGNNTYDFLSLSQSPRATALGGRAYAVQTDDIQLTLDNPSLMSKKQHQQINFNTAFYLAGTNYGSLAYAHYSDKLKTGFTAAAFYTSYGKFDGRDPSGNATGDFRAGDLILSGGASSSWKKFSYGAQLKFIFSQIESYNSIGFATDLAASYHNKDKYFTSSLIIRNLGYQLSPYVDGGERDKLPLDISIAVSKRFIKLPFRLQVVMQQLNKWDIVYPRDNTGNVILNSNSNNISFTDKLFAHFIFGGEIEAGKPVRIRFGYNHLIRQSLAVGDKKGLAGFSGGFGLHIKQFSVDYAIQKIHSAGVLNQIGIMVNLQEFGTKTN